MNRTLFLVVVALAGLSACASSSPPPSGVAAGPGPIVELRRLVVVASGESKFTVEGTRMDAARTLDEVIKWIPSTSYWALLAKAIRRGIDWLAAEERSQTASRQVGNVSPGAIVADAFARTLLASGRFDHVRTMEREPTGDDRRHIDGLVRVRVPAWGVVRVREGKPEVVSAYADVHAQLVQRPTGVPVWEHDEDVTHGERLPLQAYTANSELLREELADVLQRAGQRLANELLYARSAGR